MHAACVDDKVKPEGNLFDRFTECLSAVVSWPSSGTKDFKYEAVGGEEEEIKRARYLNFYSLENIGIFASYFCVGFALYFLSTPLTYYAIDTLNVSSAESNVLSTVQYLPWAFKLFFGLLSDNLPIGSSRRKPYFIIGWSIFILCNLFLAALVSPSLNWLVALVFFQTCGYMLSDVVTDAMIVERSKYEEESVRGSMQAIGYIWRFFGSIIGATLGAILYNKDDWGWGLSIGSIFVINAVVPFVFVLPLSIALLDISGPPRHGFVDQVLTVWETFKLKSVWRPMSFVFIYNVMMIPNAAWSNFLIDGLDFSNFDIGLLSIFAAIFAWLGIVVYKKFFFATSWRGVYVATTAINFVFSILQLLLIFRINVKMGISDIFFSLGDNSAASFVMAFQFLPICVMYIGLCPDGSEGTTYAALTTLSNLAGAVAYDIGTLMTGIWDVSNSTLEDGDYDGMWKLTLLTSLLQPLPLVLIFLLPANKTEQRELQANETSSWVGGAALVATLVISILATLIESIVTIYL